MMRLYPPIYPEDGILQPGVFPGGDPVNLRKTGTCGADIVHSNIGAESAPKLEVDAPALVRQAIAARSAWIGSKLKSYYEALVRKFARGGQSEMENYLAASQSLADLEERIRRYERMQSRRY